MQTANYNEQMEKILSKIKESGQKPTLLLHSCCAPCSSAVIERLKDFFDLTVYYYNPNLDGQPEYDLRATEQKRLCALLDVKCLVEKYESQEFFSCVQGLEKEKEGGARCVKCFELRLLKTAEQAKQQGYEYFATTLTVSPLKNATILNAIGEKIEQQVGVKYLISDFKKKNGYKRSIELSNEYSLYRQNYCGCEFSKNQSN